MEIGHVTQTGAAVVAPNSAAAPENKGIAPAKPLSAATDQVQISATARALEEAKETPVQVAQATNNVNVQAQQKQVVEEAYESSAVGNQMVQTTLGFYQ
ncbi:MAG: hypothetical protein M0009_07265 [Deltaproteobacteria bacterium]|nr:hypothetical protein [Deltaproteobacteria bacterium]